jgi:hypothetical protein
MQKCDEPIRRKFSGDSDQAGGKRRTGPVVAMTRAASTLVEYALAFGNERIGDDG